MRFHREEKKKGKVKAWFLDGKDWLQFGVGWNLFPLLLAGLIFLTGRSQDPFVTVAGTFSMGIFSIASSAIGNAEKLKISHGLMDFARILSAIIYLMFFSEFASNAVVLGRDISLEVQLGCLVVLSILLVYTMFYGVQLERMSKSFELTGDTPGRKQRQRQRPKQKQRQRQKQGQQQVNNNSSKKKG